MYKLKGALLDPDFALVTGLVLGGFSIPAMMSAVIDDRAPRVPAFVILVAFGLVLFAITQNPGGYALQDIPVAFVSVISQLTR